MMNSSRACPLAPAADSASRQGVWTTGLYQDSEEKLAFGLLGKWKTRRAMEKHFRTNEFNVLVGAARILGESFTMSIAAVSKAGGIELTSELSAPPQQKR